MQGLKIAGVAVVSLAGIAILGLVFYSYLFVPGGYRVPDISEVQTSELIIKVPNGQFLDKSLEVFPDVVRAELGFKAPDFQLPTFDGAPVRLSDFHGKPILINFWANWCSPCRAEMPALQNFHEQYGDQVVLIGINWNDNREKALGLLEREGISYINVIDEGGTVFVDYRLVKLPVSFWLDEEGVIRGYWFGAMTEENMIEGFNVITDALNEVGDN